MRAARFCGEEMRMKEKRITEPKHGGEHHVDHPGDDEAFRGRKDGPDIDTEKREKELKRQEYGQ
jgi:hypothetical protein